MAILGMLAGVAALVIVIVYFVMCLMGKEPLKLLGLASFVAAALACKFCAATQIHNIFINITIIGIIIIDFVLLVIFVIMIIITNIKIIIINKIIIIIFLAIIIIIIINIEINIAIIIRIITIVLIIM